MDKNYGLDLRKEEQDQSEDDFVFGSVSEPGLAEGIDFVKYFPEGEVQRGVDDFMDCASRGPHNILETKLTYLVKERVISGANHAWLIEKGYADQEGNVTLSDRFTAIMSGTRPTGNSLKAPVHSIHKNGVIPKKMLPADVSMTWAQYHDASKITQEMKDLGQEFLERFPINYEKLKKEEFPEALKTDMLDIALWAWGLPVEGVYHREPYTPNHVVAAYSKVLYKVFDNYIDTYDGDFIKRLSADYNLYNYGYKIIVREEGHTKVEFNFEAPESLASKIKAFLKSLGINL